MSPHRLPERTPEGRITDRNEMYDLVYGDSEARLGHPERGDKYNLNPTPQEWADARRRVEEGAPPRTGTIEGHIWSYASVDAWRRRQHERLRYLLVNDLLAGKALERGENLEAPS